MSYSLRGRGCGSVVNPSIGIGKIGGRLFGDPIQAIESDLRAARHWYLVTAKRGVVILAVDQCTLETVWANPLRERIARGL